MVDYVPKAESGVSASAVISDEARSRTTKRALEHAALRLLNDGGLLAGFTLQQVAEEAGFAKSLVYHYYGDRQALLRSALRHGAMELQHTIRSAPYASFDRRLSTLARAALRYPDAVPLMTLLLIDRDPRLRTMPIRDQTMGDFYEDLRLGLLPPDADIDALLGLGNALIYGYILFRDGLARQMDVGRGVLDSRFRRLMPSLGRRLAQQDWSAEPRPSPELPPTRFTPAGDSAPELLEAAAIDLINEQGILAGLNLRMVASRAGVHRGLVYHHFGSRRDLLRAALHRRLRSDLADASRGGNFGDRVFAESIRHSTSIRLMALLAIDGDDAYEPFGPAPRGRLTTARMMSLCMALGHALYRQPFARESGMSVEEWDRRVFAVWSRVTP